MADDVLPLVDDTLDEWKPVIGRDFEGYRNHVRRMVSFCLALAPAATAEEREKIAIAGVFHDIGIWTSGTFDYIPPSVRTANAYLARRGLEEWAPEVEQMIRQHHKLRPVTNPDGRLVELFRRGDLVDFSLGAIRFGLPGSVVRQLKAAYPNTGFHATVLRQMAGWFIRHPLNPAPMVKW